MCYLYNALYKVSFLSFLKFHVGCCLIVHISGKLWVQFFPFIYFMYLCKQILHPVCSFLWYEKESRQTYNFEGALAQLHLDPRHISSFPDSNLPFLCLIPHRTSHTFTFVCCFFHIRVGKVYIFNIQLLKI